MPGIEFFWIRLNFIGLNRMPPPELPKNQDCHELWSKKRRRQMRELEAVNAAGLRGGGGSMPSSCAGGPTGDSSTQSGNAVKNEGSGSLTGSGLLPASRSTSQPGSEKMDDSSIPG